MNHRITAIKQFIESYKTLDPYLQSITASSYTYYLIELDKEYERISKHPYPNEYKEYQRTMRRNINKYKRI